jgi:hypothetical protein
MSIPGALRPQVLVGEIVGAIEGLLRTPQLGVSRPFRLSMPLAYLSGIFIEYSGAWQCDPHTTPGIGCVRSGITS